MSSMYRLRTGTGAFTLIELLIVVAIIAILAAIAVPNFLEAQTRSKVSRVKADHRTVKIALECYVTDHNKYPTTVKAGAPASPAPTDLEERFNLIGFRLTTPIAYLTSIPGPDPFIIMNDKVDQFYGNQNGFVYYNYKDRYTWLDSRFPKWARKIAVIHSLGPNKRDDGCWMIPAAYIDGMPPSHIFTYYGPYDPSNGTISGGDIDGFTGELDGCPGTS